MLIKVLKVFFLRGFGAASAVLVTYLITQNFVVDEAGILLFAITNVAVLSQIMMFGSGQYIIRAVSSNYESDKSNCDVVLSGYLNCVLAFVTLAVIFSFFFNNYIYSFFFKTGDSIIVPYIFTASAFVSFYLIISKIFIGLQRSNTAAVIEKIVFPLSILISFSVLAYLLGLSFSPVEFLQLYILIAGLVFLLSIYYLSFNFNFELKISLPHGDEAKRIFYFFQICLLSLTMQHSSMYAVAYFLEPTDIAYFNLGKRITMLLPFLLFAINSVFAPKFSKSYANKNYERLDKQVLKASRIAVLLTIPIAVVLLLFSDKILILFGDSYVEAELIFLILAFGQLINILTGSVSFLLTMTGHEKDLRNVILVSSPLSLIISIIATQYAGVIGAAVSSSFSLALQNLLLVIIVKRRLGFNTLNIFRYKFIKDYK